MIDLPLPALEIRCLNVLFNTDGIANTLSWLMISRWSVGACGSLVSIKQDNLSLDWMILV